MWLPGFGLALIPIGYGIRCLPTGHTAFWCRRGEQLDLTGSAAVALAIAYVAAGVFIHAHRFWGLHSTLEAFNPVLKVLAVMLFLGCLGYTAYKILA
jgi:hypothetical protein